MVNYTRWKYLKKRKEKYPQRHWRITREWGIAKPGYSGEQKTREMRAASGAFPMGTRTQFALFTTTQLSEAREPGTGVMWGYIILNACVVTKVTIQTASKHVKRYSTSSVIKDIHIKTTFKYCCTFKTTVKFSPERLHRKRLIMPILDKVIEQLKNL